MRHLRVHSLNGGWVDKDRVLLHAAFQLLRDYVEQERPDRIIDWNADPRHAKAWREIKSLYRWWTKTRPKRKSPLDTKGLKKPRLKFEPNEDRTLYRMIPHDKKKYRVYDRALRTDARLRARWLEEDQRNLHRLVEVRPFLWT